MFVQYTCEMDKIQQDAKYKTIAMASIIMMFVAHMFIQVTYYLRQTAKLDLLKYDIETCTAGDYTVEMDITKEMYNDFLINQWPSV